MSRAGNERTGNKIINIPVKAGEEILQAELVVIDENGYAKVAVAEANVKAAGISQKYVDNRNGEDGEVTIEVRRGAFVMENAGDITNRDILKPCYIKDSVTVTMEDTGTSVAGTILEVDKDKSVTVEFK